MSVGTSVITGHNNNLPSVRKLVATLVKLGLILTELLSCSVIVRNSSKLVIALVMYAMLGPAE
jgi:hypothetical protein